jgi:hypothetical protein
MRPLLFALACSLATAGVLAQTAPSPSKTRPATKATKPAKRPAPAPVVEEPAEIDTERMSVAPMVLRGESQCEFKQKIQLTEHPTLPGRFLLEYNNLKYVLTPQPTTTGVIRLEDKRTGLVWLQVPVKSMLMDTKKGQRLVDNCMHSAQVAEVEAMKLQETGKAQ